MTRFGELELVTPVSNNKGRKPGQKVYSEPQSQRTQTSCLSFPRLLISITSWEKFPNNPVIGNFVLKSKQLTNVAPAATAMNLKQKYKEQCKVDGHRRADNLFQEDR